MPHLLPMNLTPTYVDTTVQTIAPCLRHVKIPEANSYVTPERAAKVWKHALCGLGVSSCVIAFFPVAPWIILSVCALAVIAGLLMIDAERRVGKIDYKDPEQVKEILCYLSKIKLEDLREKQISPEQFYQWMQTLSKNHVLDELTAARFANFYGRYHAAEGLAQAAMYNLGARVRNIEPVFTRTSDAFMRGIRTEIQLLQDTDNLAKTTLENFTAYRERTLESTDEAALSAREPEVLQ